MVLTDADGRFVISLPSRPDATLTIAAGLPVHQDLIWRMAEGRIESLERS